MKSLLEYLNRSSGKTLDYGPLVPHYNSEGKFDGVEISDAGFVVFAQSNHASWKTAVGTAKKFFGGELPTREEWKEIRKYMKNISQIFVQNGYKSIDVFKSYWTSDVKSRMETYLFTPSEPDDEWYADRRMLHTAYAIKRF